MRQCDLSKVIAGSTTGRSEISLAISNLVEEVASLALHVKRIVAIADAAKAERAVESVRIAELCATETIEQTEIKAESSATACVAQAIYKADAANFPLSPQQDSWKSNAGTSEMGPLRESNAESDGLANAEAEPTDASCRAENPIAAHVLKLSDRLGGLIKSPPSQPLDQDT